MITVIAVMVSPPFQMLSTVHAVALSLTRFMPVSLYLRLCVSWDLLFKVHATDHGFAV